MKVCIGIISIGKLYIAEFEKLFKPSVVSYCERYGYDLKIFTEFLDPTQTHLDTISFQKCLVPSHLQDYDLVVVLDADIFIEERAPPIHTLELHGKIGLVDEVKQTSPSQYSYLETVGFVDSAQMYYKKVDLELTTNSILNTGVMICDPKQHAQSLKMIYDKYIEKCVGHTRGFHYEQGCIGYELQIGQLYTVIPNEWNCLYVHSQLLGIPIPSAYFLHFAGMRGSQRESALARHTCKSVRRWGIKK